LVTTVKPPGVREIAPVHTAAHAVKCSAFFRRDRAYIEVFKYISARAYGFSEILVPVGAFVGLPQIFGFCQKLFAKPFRRGFQVSRAVAKPVRPLFETVFVCPVVPADRRVVTLEIPKR